MIYYPRLIYLNCILKEMNNKTADFPNSRAFLSSSLWPLWKPSKSPKQSDNPSRLLGREEKEIISLIPFPFHISILSLCPFYRWRLNGHFSSKRFCPHILKVSRCSSRFSRGYIHHPLSRHDGI